MGKMMNDDKNKGGMQFQTKPDPGKVSEGLRQFVPFEGMGTFEREPYSAKEQAGNVGKFSERAYLKEDTMSPEAKRMRELYTRKMLKRDLSKDEDAELAGYTNKWNAEFQRYSKANKFRTPNQFNIGSKVTEELSRYNPVGESGYTKGAGRGLNNIQSFLKGAAVPGADIGSLLNQHLNYAQERSGDFPSIEDGDGALKSDDLMNLNAYFEKNPEHFDKYKALTKGNREQYGSYSGVTPEQQKNRDMVKERIALKKKANQPVSREDMAHPALRAIGSDQMPIIHKDKIAAWRNNIYQGAVTPQDSAAARNNPQNFHIGQQFLDKYNKDNPNRKK